MFHGCPYMINYKFNNNDIALTRETNKNEKCIVCYETFSTYYKLCNEKYDNDHFYCKDCIDILNIKKCCICATEHILVVFVNNN